MRASGIWEKSRSLTVYDSRRAPLVERDLDKHILLATTIGIAASWIIRPAWLKNGPLVVVIALMTVWLAYFTVLKDNSAPTAQPSSKTIGEAPSDVPRQAVSEPPKVKFDNTGGWGPDRPTFTMHRPAPYAVFNSITDNNAQGDERNFIQCHDKSQSGGWDSNLVAVDGRVYECVVSFNNDVADNLDNGNPSAELHDARLSMGLPGKSLYDPGITALLSASNAKSVWSSCNFLSAHTMKIIYQYGSARMYTNGTPKGGLQLAEKLQGNAMISGIAVTPGVLLGYGQEDGIVRHSGQYSGYVRFDIKVELDPPTG